MKILNKEHFHVVGALYSSFDTTVPIQLHIYPSLLSGLPYLRFSCLFSIYTHMIQPWPIYLTR